jgi:hypothetical protein
LNLVRYYEWLLENIPGIEDKKVLNFTAQSFYLRKRFEGGPQFEIYGKTVNGLIEIEFECETAGEKIENIRNIIEEEKRKRNKLLERKNYGN